MVKTIFPDNLGFECFSLTKENGRLLNEIGFEGYWFNPLKEFNKDWRKLKDTLLECNIIPAGMELPVEFRLDKTTFSRDLENLEQISCYAEKLGIDRTVTWIVPFSEELSFKENFKLHSFRLGEIAKVLSSHGIKLGLEFQGPKSLRYGKKNWFIHTLDGVMSLISSIKEDNLGILMDIWHWNLAREESFEFGAISADDIVAVHLSDALVGLKDIEYQDLKRSLPCSTGVFDTKEFISDLLKIGYNGPVFAEPFDASLKELSAEEAFKKTYFSILRALESDE